MKTFLIIGSLCAAIATIYPVAIFIFEPTFIPFYMAIVFHILSAALCTSGIYLLTSKKARSKKRGNVWWIYVLILCLALPVYGMIMSLAIYLWQAIRERRPPPIVSDEITVPPPEAFEKAPSGLRQIEILERLDIEPFIDIFKTGSTELKKSAVKFLGTIRSRKAINALMIALMDEDIEVSLFAAGVLGVVEDGFAKEMKTKLSRHKRNPGDKASGIDLANFFLSYTEIGLLDKVTKNYYYNETINVLDKLPPDDETMYLKARAYFFLDNYNMAGAEIKKCLVINPSSANYHELYLEILFAKREYVELTDKIENIRKVNFGGPTKTIIDYWC